MGYVLFSVSRKLKPKTKGSYFRNDHGNTMSQFVKARRLHTLSRCPSCGRTFALLPKSWLRLCVNYVLMRQKQYVCRFCGTQHTNVIPPFAKT